MREPSAKGAAAGGSVIKRDIGTDVMGREGPRMDERLYYIAA
jgi:hypothetical protein